MTKMEKVGSLLSAPMSTTVRSEVKFWRGNVGDQDGDDGKSNGYKNLSEIFVLPIRGRNYERQFYHVYRNRLELLKPRIEVAAKRKFGAAVRIQSLCDLGNDEVSDGSKKDTRVIVIGTIFKHQELKPNILKEISEDNEILMQPVHRGKYISEKDEIILEDELQRIKLIPKKDKDGNPTSKTFTISGLPNGVVCGVLGEEVVGGKFEVEDIIFPILNAPKEVIKENNKNSSGNLMVIMSGLGLGSNIDPMPLELALSWLIGEAGEMSDQEENSKIQRVILAGNSLADTMRDRDEMNKAKYLTKNSDAASLDAVCRLDDILLQLADSIDVDLMPGANDPANQNMPQQPLHHCLFPQASVYPTFQSVTNPYMFETTHGIVLGTAGQNVDDVLSNSDIEDPLNVLEQMVRWCHIAPTCPDTLGCFPYPDGTADPFILNSPPRMFFVGNQKDFSYRKMKTTVQSGETYETLLVALPPFADKKKACLVNLATMECEEMLFDTGFDTAANAPAGMSPIPNN